jgi:hypothetical protein
VFALQSRTVQTKEQRIIEDAAKLIGPARLAKELGVSEQELAKWIDGSQVDRRQRRRHR